MVQHTTIMNMKCQNEHKVVCLNRSQLKLEYTSIL